MEPLALSHAGHGIQERGRAVAEHANDRRVAVDLLALSLVRHRGQVGKRRGAEPGRLLGARIRATLERERPLDRRRQLGAAAA